MKVVLVMVGALLAAGVAVLFGSLILQMVEIARALIRFLGKLFAAILLAAAAGLATGIAAGRYSDFDGVGAGLLAGLLLLPVALFVILSRRRPTETPFLQVSEACHMDNLNVEAVQPENNAAPRPRSWIWPRRRRAAPGPRPKDEPVLAAFGTAAVMADWAPSRVAAVRTSCTRFLRQADAVPLDVEAMEWASFIRNRVPQLVEACATECEQATPLERETLVEDLLESLEAIGAEADRRRRQARQGGHSAFRVLREHVANRTRKASWL